MQNKPVDWAALESEREEFRDAERLWRNEIAPALARRETRRAQVVRRAIWRTVAIGAVIWVLIQIVAATRFGGVSADPVFLGVIVGALLAGLATAGDWIRVATMKAETKSLIVGTAAGAFGFTYDTLHPDFAKLSVWQALQHYGKSRRKGDAPSPTPAYRRLKEAKLLSSHDTRSFEDLIHGERAGAKFELVEAKLVDSSGDSSTTVFQGVLLHVAFPQRFLGRTILSRSSWWRFGRGPGGLEEVKLVSKELEEAFTVYSSDQVEARAILTPDRIERMIALERSFSGGKLRGVFEDGHMSLALEADDQFEAGSIFNQLVEPERFQTSLREIGKVCDLIDAFLDRDWGRENAG
ncbi:MAG: DUF3137 domain-containing protein [Pseudomonadota bacterium]